MTSFSWIEVFVISVLAAVVAFFLGFAAGMDSFAKNCDNYGKQVRASAVYVCHKEQSK